MKFNVLLNVMIFFIVCFVMFVYFFRSRIFLINWKVCLVVGMSFVLSVIYGFLIVFFIWNVVFMNFKIIFIVDDIGFFFCFVLINIYFFVIWIKIVSVLWVVKDLKIWMILVMFCIFSLNVVNVFFIILIILMLFEIGF